VTAAIIAALAAMAISVAGAEVAVAAGAPSATTNAASKLTSTSVTLNATVFSNKNATTYYFQYGRTTAYGAQTANQGTVNGNAGKSVSADVTGLMPSTTYHFRVVAASSAGTSFGSDTMFTTAALGAPARNAVTISSRPGSVTFGRATTIAGQVSGAGNGGVKVTLEANPYPYTGGFKPTSLTVTATATGAYSLAVTPSVNTRYLVIAKTKPPVTSPQTAVAVRVRVTFRLSTLRPAIGHLVRFSGTVTPAHNGRVAQIQRRTTTGAWRTVASATLVAATPVNGIAISKFSKRLRISRNTTYRVRVNPKDGDHAAGTSATRTVRVR
jgi:hypothetical protein